MSLLAKLYAERKARRIRLGDAPPVRIVPKPAEVFDVVEVVPEVMPVIPVAPIEIRARDGRGPTIKRIMETVCRRYDIRWPDLISSKRSKKLVRARQISMYLCKTMTPHSFVLIGQWLGNRDHTTIMYGYRKVEGMRRWDSDFDNEVESLVAELLS